MWRQTDYPRLEALPPYKSAELDDWNHVASLQLSGEIWRLTAQLHNLKPYSYDRGGHFDQGHRGCQRANVHSDNWENPNQSYHQNHGYMQIVQPDLGEVTVWDQQAPVPLVGWHPLPRGEGWYLCVQSQHACEQRWPASIRKVSEQTERCLEQPERQAGYVLVASRALNLTIHTSILRIGDIQRHRDVPLRGTLGGTRFPEEGSIGDRGTGITVCGCPGSQYQRSRATEYQPRAEHHQRKECVPIERHYTELMGDVHVESNTYRPWIGLQAF